MRCPGCGLTHSVWYLLHGQPGAAMHWNKLGFVMLPAAVLFAAGAGSWRLPVRWRTLFAIPREQLRAAGRWTWSVLTVAIALLLATVFVMPERAILRLAPVCERKLRTGLECPLCGMTHAFVAISRGEFGSASARNAGSLPLFAGFLFNEVIFVCWLTCGWKPRSLIGAIPATPRLDGSQPVP